MKLKQEDRELFKSFFDRNRDWLINNSLNVEDNLIELKRMFIKYMNDEKQTENISFMVFILTLDQEIIESKKKLLVREYRKSTNRKLNWKSAYPLLTDNEEILVWIKQANIAYEVSRADMEELGRSVKQKLMQNENERISSFVEIRDKIVR